VSRQAFAPSLCVFAPLRELLCELQFRAKAQRKTLVAQREFQGRL
jgi:hypothetical protein